MYNPDLNLSPFKRCRIIYHDPDSGRRKSIVAKDGTTPSVGSLKPGIKFISFTAQQDSSIHIIGASLIDRVVFESQDRVYMDWHEVGKFDINGKK